MPNAPAASEMPPMRLARSGWLYAGGKTDSRVEGSPTVGQLYAEFLIPEVQTHPYPLVMIHGGNQTGSNYTGTPDGREGWAQYFARRGHAVYVVDTVARGRSPHWSASHGVMAPARAGFAEKRFVAPERFKLWPQAEHHTQFPGTGQPGDAAYEAFMASQVPSLADFPKQQSLNREAGAALLDRIGPAILLTHSQGGALGWPIADARPHLVKAIVAVEPNGPPVKDVTMVGAPDWFKESEAIKPYGLTHVPLAYDPPLAHGETLSFVQQAQADGPGLMRGWLQAEPARKLANLTSIPVLVLMGEASYHAPYDHITVAYLRQAGVPTTFIQLADKGEHGNGHMLMIEKNSDAIAAIIAEWLAGIEAQS